MLRLLLAGSLDECVVDSLLSRIVRSGVLRVPLHSDDSVLTVLDRLEETIRRMTNRNESFCEPINPLVMKRCTVHDRRSGGTCQPRFGIESDVMYDEFGTNRKLTRGVSNERRGVG